MKADQICNCKEQHTGHICELESQQDWEAIKHITSQPSVRCQNCGAEANADRFVCMPEDL